MTEDDEQRAKVLTGPQDYLSWKNKFMFVAAMNSWFTPKTKVLTTDAVLKKAQVEWLLKTIHQDVFASLHIDETITVSGILDQLEAAFGHQYESPVLLKAKIEREIQLPKHKDPRKTFQWLDSKFQILISANSTQVSAIDYVNYLLYAMEKPECSSFWLNCRGHLNMNLDQIGVPGSEFETLVLVKRYIYRYWEAYSTKQQASPTANFAGHKSKAKCSFCVKHKRFRTAGSHADKDCLFGDQPGYTSMENKQESHYSQLFFDTGATPVSFVKDKPTHLIPEKGLVKVANGTSIRSKGTGKVRFGEIEINAIWVPDFQKNLISGIQIMNEGYTTVIQNGNITICDNITIPKDTTVYATGQMDPDTNLIELNPFNHEVNLSYQEVHERLGHVGEKTIKQTLRTVDGLEISDRELNKTKEICKSCALGKLRRKPVPKNGRKASEILEIIEIDLQGPFPIVGHDETVMNVKLVDNKSGYVKMDKPDTILEKFSLRRPSLFMKTSQTVEALI